MNLVRDLAYLNKQKGDYIVLVVDDEKIELESLRGLENTFKVTFAESGKEAISLIENGLSPDLVLADIIMPLMDGFELCDALKANNATRHIPILFHSSLNSPEDKTRAFQIGCVDYIHKPCSHSELIVRIENHIRLNEQLQFLDSIAYIDSLTKIANRRKYENDFLSEWSRSARHGEPLSLILIDIDHFKKYNDVYGHNAGDRCLEIVANTIANCTSRAGDLTARIGGEEFAIILPECTEEGCEMKAQEVVDAISFLKLEHIGSSVDKHLTVSVGAATVVPSNKGSCTDLFNVCDKALYNQKANGRNGFTLANSTYKSTKRQGIV